MIKRSLAPLGYCRETVWLEWQRNLDFRIRLEMIFCKYPMPRLKIKLSCSRERERKRHAATDGDVEKVIRAKDHLHRDEKSQGAWTRQPGG